MSRSIPKWSESLEGISQQVIKPSSLNDHIIIGSRQSVKTISIDDTNSGLSSIRSMKSSTASSAIAFHPIADCVVASAGSNGEVSTLYYGAQNIAPLIEKWIAHSRAIHAIEFLPITSDEITEDIPVHLITVSADGEVNMWEISSYPTGRRDSWRKPTLLCNLRPEGYKCGLRDLDVRLTINGEGFEMLIACDDGSVEYYVCDDIEDVKNFAFKFKLSISTQTINSVRFSPQRGLSTSDYPFCFATGGKDSYIRVYSYTLTEAKCLCSIRTPSSVWAIRWRPVGPGGGAYIAACQAVMDSCIYIWDLTSRLMPAYVFNSHRDNVTDFFWADSYHVMSCSRDNTIQLHQIKNAIVPIEKMRTVNISFSIPHMAGTGQTLTSICDVVNREKFERDHDELWLGGAKQFGFPVTERFPALDSRSVSGISTPIGPSRAAGTGGIYTPITGAFSRSVKIQAVPYQVGFTPNPVTIELVGENLIKFISDIARESLLEKIAIECEKFATVMVQVGGEVLTTQSQSLQLISWFMINRPEMIVSVTKKALDIYQEMNDIVMVLSIGSICMFSPISEMVNLVESRKFFRWSVSLIDIFSRMGKWKLAAEFVYMSPVSEVRSLSHSRTGINLACNGCKREREIGFDQCSKCKAKLACCVLCGDLVRGLWESCPGCSHGGHTKHMDWWFSKYSVCPVPGCMHECFSTVRKSDNVFS